MKFVFCLLSIVAVNVAAAETFTLKDSVHNADFDWALAGNYVGDKAPAAKDTVKIPAGITAKLNASSASFAFVNTLNRITPAGGAELEITVGEGSAALLSCAVSVYEESDTSGKLVKRDAGELEFAGCGKLKEGNYVRDYYVNIEVKEGKLSLYQNGSEKTECFYHLSVDVSENAELQLCKTGRSYLQNLSGKGLVTKVDTDEVQQTYLYGDGYSCFDGRLSGKDIRIDITGGRHDLSCPTNDIFTVIINGKSTCGMSNFGESTKVLSSLGTGNVNFTGAEGRAVYLGTEKSTCAKQWWVGSYSIFDGGTFGGVDFTGAWGSTYSQDYHLRKIGLAGDHANECTVASSIAHVITNKDKPDCLTRYYIKKTGSGTWRFSTEKQASRRGMGVLDVENGTVKFDSIAEKGKDCSLGLADYLFGDVLGSTNDAPQVGYAYVLGSHGAAETASEGVMEYSGAENAVVTTRPFAIRSRGRIRTTGATLSFVGAYALGAGEKTLVLDSSSASGYGNKVSGLSDGTDGGVLSVEKHGDGEWLLEGVNTAGGSLFARGGTMVINKPSRKYKWYRFVITENAYACERIDTTLSTPLDDSGNPTAPSEGEKGNVQIGEIALYDANGNNLLWGFKQNEPITQFAFEGGDARAMVPREVAIGSVKKISNFSAASQRLDNLFDGSGKTATGSHGGCKGGIRQDDPSTWLPIVVRLADDAPAAVRLDFVTGRPLYGKTKEAGGSYNGRNMTALRVDASADGLNWETVAEKKAIILPENYIDKLLLWDSDLTTLPSTSENLVRKDKGMVLSASETKELKSVDSYAFSSVGAADGAAVKVVGGGLLEVAGLKVDAAAAPGVLENIRLAGNGTIDVFNLDPRSRDALDLPLDLAAVPGAANVSDWTVRIGGRRVKWKCSLNADGSVRISPSGVYMILR